MSTKPCPCCGGNGWEGSDCANVQAELEERLVAERALADRLANAVACLSAETTQGYEHIQSSFDAWKEARK